LTIPCHTSELTPS
jgi:hypothetical protein